MQGHSTIVPIFKSSVGIVLPFSGICITMSLILQLNSEHIFSIIVKVIGSFLPNFARVAFDISILLAKSILEICNFFNNIHNGS